MGIHIEPRLSGPPECTPCVVAIALSIAVSIMLKAAFCLIKYVK